MSEKIIENINKIVEKKYQEIYDQQLLVGHFFVGADSIYHVVEILQVNYKCNFANIMVKDKRYNEPYKKQVFVRNNVVVLLEEIQGFSCDRIMRYIPIL